MRFWIEFRNPKLKCERVGHRNIIEWRQGYIKPHWDDWDYYRTVVNDARQERRCCRRCGDADEWKFIKKEGINSFGAPKHMWADIEERGGHFYASGRRKWVAE